MEQNPIDRLAAAIRRSEATFTGEQIQTPA